MKLLYFIQGWPPLTIYAASLFNDDLYLVERISNISASHMHRGVENHRYRLRKKLLPKKEVILTDFILSL